MSYPVFYVPAGDVLPVFFDTFAGSTGASITMSGLAVTDIEIYKDGSVTQRSSDAGYTLLDTDGIDFDGLTGIHGFSIDTGDNTDAGFYTVGAWFTVVVSAVTVDSQTVSFVACQFRLMAAESVAAKPKVDVDAWLGTAAATPTVAGVPEVDITHISGAAVSTTTAQLGVNAVQISGDGTAADNLETAFDGTAGAVPWLGIIDQGTMQAGSTGTTAVLRAGLSLADDVVIGSTLIITAGTGAGQSRYVTDFVGATDTATVDAWVTTPDNTSEYKLIFGPPSSASDFAAIADAVWDEATAGHSTAGSTGKALTDALADTNELQTDWANGGRLDLILDARASQTSVDTIDDFLDTEVAAIKAKTDQLTFGTANRVDAQVYGIETGAITAASVAADAGAEIADAVHDEVVEGATTLRQLIRGFAAVLLGKASGLETTEAVYRDIGDTKDRVTATVDADGNRTAVTRDLT